MTALAILDEINSVGLNLPEYAIAIVIAAALVAAALASAADVAARAYVQVHATQPPTEPPVHVGEFDVIPENGDIRVHHVVGSTS
jgi:hypothetical protein